MHYKSKYNKLSSILANFDKIEQKRWRLFKIHNLQFYSIIDCHRIDFLRINSMHKYTVRITIDVNLKIKLALLLLLALLPFFIIIKVIIMIE